MYHILKQITEAFKVNYKEPQLLKYEKNIQEKLSQFYGVESLSKQSIKLRSQKDKDI